MTRVMIVVGRCGAGRTCGAERMAERSSAALARAGHAVTLVHGDALVSLGPTAGTRSETRAGAGGGAASGNPRRRTAAPPDVVHAFDLADPEPVADAWARAARLGARFALTPASTSQLWPDLELGGRLCRGAQVVFVLNAREASDLRSLGVAPERIRMVPNAPDLRGIADPLRFRRRYRIDNDIVLFLGRRLPSKGFQTLLDAVPEVLRRHPDTTVVFAGPVTDGRRAGGAQVRDVGMLDEQAKHDALAACSLLCLPTSADVFPLVFMEAWACGRPVVSGRFAGVDEVVRDGVDGLVVTPQPLAVAEAVDALLSDPRLRQRLGQAGLRRVETELTWDRVAAKYLAGYAAAQEKTAQEKAAQEKAVTP